MRGEFLGVWSETWRAIWVPLREHASATRDMFCELYREIAPALKSSPSDVALAEIINVPTASRKAFRRVLPEDLKGERRLVGFIEGASAVLEEVGGDSLSNRYFNLLGEFIERFSLRYELRRPCLLCPTLTGVFASLMRELRIVASRDAHLDSLMKEFEAAIRDLRSNSSESHIKTCIQKQFNLLEAAGSAYPGVNDSTLGKICDQVGTWPHAKLKEAMKNMYGFGCDYPGIRHGGTRMSAIRPIDMRDMVATCILLTGFAPYLVDQLDSDVVYRGS